MAPGNHVSQANEENVLLRSCRHFGRAKTVFYTILSSHVSSEIPHLVLQGNFCLESARLARPWTKLTTIIDAKAAPVFLASKCCRGMPLSADFSKVLAMVKKRRLSEAQLSTFSTPSDTYSSLWILGYSIPSEWFCTNTCALLSFTRASKVFT